MSAQANELAQANVHTSESASASASEAAAAAAAAAAAVPPMKYDLIPINSYTAFSQINDLTTTYPISSEFMENLDRVFYARYNNQQNTIFGYLLAPENALITQQVIGTDGYFFKLTTTRCGVDFIWNNQYTGKFLFYGPSKFKVVRAMNAINWRINKYTKAAANAADIAALAALEAEADTLSDTDYSDMPGLIPAASLVSASLVSA